MTRAPTVVVELTVEEAVMVARLLSDGLTFSRRAAVLAARVVARIEAQVGDAEAIHARFEVDRRGNVRAREFDCPYHQRALRLDRGSLASMVQVYYCPVAGCSYQLERP